MTTDAQVASVNEPEGDEPPEPEAEGFREEQIKAEIERRKRQRERMDQRSEEKKLELSGKANEDDTPGATLADRPGDEPRPKITGDRKAAQPS